MFRIHPQRGRPRASSSSQLPAPPRLKGFARHDLLEPLASLPSELDLPSRPHRYSSPPYPSREVDRGNQSRSPTCERDDNQDTFSDIEGFFDHEDNDDDLPVSNSKKRPLHDRTETPSTKLHREDSGRSKRSKKELVTKPRQDSWRYPESAIEGLSQGVTHDDFEYDLKLPPDTPHDPIQERTFSSQSLSSNATQALLREDSLLLSRAIATEPRIKNDLGKSARGSTASLASEPVQTDDIAEGLVAQPSEEAFGAARGLDGDKEKVDEREKSGPHAPLAKEAATPRLFDIPATKGDFKNRLRDLQAQIQVALGRMLDTIEQTDTLQSNIHDRLQNHKKLLEERGGQIRRRVQGLQVEASSLRSRAACDLE